MTQNAYMQRPRDKKEKERNLSISIIVIGVETLLNPLEVVRLELLGEFDCVRDCQRHVAVQHEWVVGADFLSPVFEELDVLSEPFVTSRGPIGTWDLPTYKPTNKNRTNTERERIRKTNEFQLMFACIATNPRALALTGFEEVQYTGRRSLLLPPRSAYTGSPRSLPRRSHTAMSMALSACTGRPLRP